MEGDKSKTLTKKERFELIKKGGRFEFYKNQFLMNQDKSPTVEMAFDGAGAGANSRKDVYGNIWIPYNTQLEAEKPYKWLSPFFLYRESILEANKDRYFSIELLSQSWELEPESMRAPYVAKSAIRMDEYENMKKAQHNKYLEQWISGDENYEKSVSDEPNELVRPATGFLVYLEEFLASANDKSMEEFTDICKNRSLNTVSVIADLTEIWESMSETAKQPYLTKADEMMAAYDQMWIARIKTMERPTSDN
ncbi:High mobility group box domain superfamily [Arabidopsis suecica]|uniref:High mobility group box domain superfamily n=1 Tax=Arabidopsis suecica TaxID=45249 RepID=A0A8T2CFT5_ARASU|nr:High mobility group box domain superfamily [Arabidopsis suecica]